MEDFEMGGVENVTLRLISGLLDISPNYNISVIGLRTDGVLFRQFDSVSNVTSLTGNNFFQQCKSLKKNIDEIVPDIVFFTKGGLSRFSFLFGSNIKTYVVQHVPIALPRNRLHLNFLRRLFATFLYRTVTGVVCVSDGIKDDLIAKKVVPEERVTRIYNPVLDDKLFKLSKEVSVEYSDYFVCIGRLHFQKGYDFLIEIVKYHKRFNPNVKVVIIGDGPLRSCLEQKIKDFDLEDNILLHGEVPNPFPYIKNSKALLLPSRWEGLPTVLVEALALKKQVISFDCPYGPKELTCGGRYGFLVDSADYRNFSAAMSDVNHSPKPELDVSEFLISSSCLNYISLFSEGSHG
ncbi:glycosyltransferase [Veronia pacifica]|nr:glycosyltransferase [Veronia pacifica]